MFEKPYSDDTARAIDEEVKAIVDEVRDRARELLEEKRDLLDAMAETLLEEEVIGPETLVDLLGERPHGGEYVALRNGQSNGRATGEHGESGEPQQGVDAEGEPSDSPPSEHAGDDPGPTETSGDGAAGQAPDSVPDSGSTLRPRSDEDES
jgi:cell division protease FtsH